MSYRKEIKDCPDWQLLPWQVFDALGRADARIAELEKKAALYDQIQRAAELLPDRCEIQLTVENGSGWVELFTGHAWVEPSPDGDLAEQVSECIDRALEGDE